MRIIQFVAAFTLTCTVFVYSIQSSLAQCASGLYFDTILLGCVSCDAGTFKNASGNEASLCLPCPPGSECPSAYYAQGCSAGTFSLGNATSCGKCPPGYACESTALAPERCLPGSYSLGGQATVCLPGGRGLLSFESKCGCH